MKKIIIGSLLVVGLAAGFAFAHGNGNYSMKGYGHHMNGPGMMGKGARGYGCQGPGWLLNDDAVTVEQRQEFLDATVALRKQMSEKRFELKEAVRNQDSTPAQLAAIEKEIIDIRTKIQEQALALQETSK